MKSKYSSLLFVLLFILLLAYAVFNIYSSNESAKKTTANLPRINTVIPVVTVKKSQLDLIEKDIFLENKDYDKREYTDLSVLGYSKINSDSQSQSNNDRSGFGKNYLVSMAIVFDGNKYCVINNQFYKEGESISNDIVVQRIQKERVLINEYGNERWHEVAGNQFKNKEERNELLGFSQR